MIWQLREFPELYCDSLVRDEAGCLLFMSCFGRDGALQQMLAAFSLPTTQGGVQRLSVVDGNGRATSVTLGNPDRLSKLTGRLPANLFGQLTHLWVYDESVASIDHANRSAWLVWSIGMAELPELSDVQAEIWATVKLLSPVPLLDHWLVEILGAIGEDGLRWTSRSSYPPLGRAVALKLTLPEDFSARVSRLIRTGTISLERENLSTSCDIAALLAA